MPRNSNVNRLTDGVAGAIWDGVYFGAGEFNNTVVGGGGPGAAIQCDAKLTAARKLTLQATGKAREGANDDGCFPCRVVSGNISVSVRVAAPFNN